MGFVSFLAGLYFGSWTLKLECKNLSMNCLLNLATEPSEKIIISGSFFSLGFISIMLPNFFLISSKSQRY